MAVTQKNLSKRIDKASHQEIFDSAQEVEDKARLASLSLPHSGDWL